MMGDHRIPPVISYLLMSKNSHFPDAVFGVVMLISPPMYCAYDRLSILGAHRFLSTPGRHEI